MALFSCYGEQSVNQSRTFIKNPPCADAHTGHLGTYPGSREHGTCPQGRDGGERPTQIMQESDNIIFPLFHPGDDDTNTEYTLLGYCLLQLFIKWKSRQENKDIKIGPEVI